MSKAVELPQFPILHLGGGRTRGMPHPLCYLGPPFPTHLLVGWEEV